MQQCVCGTGKLYTNCCGVFISGHKLPETPEELMRSRYTAYTQADVAYISDTMKAPVLNNFDAETARTWALNVNWRKLDVIKSSVNKTQGFVEFVVYFEEQGVTKSIREKSEFRQDNGRWFYVDGES